MKGHFSYKVLSQEVDFLKKQTLAAFGTALLESAARNADANGFGLRLLQRNNTTWVLNKMVIDFAKTLSDGQFYKVETWVGDVNRLATTRYFRVVDADENLVAEVYSNWVMLDMETRRPVNLDEVEGLADAVESEKLLMERPTRILPFDEPPVFSSQAKYSDIDINGHVNSMRYVQWVSDLFSRDFYERRTLKRFEINYASEVMWGDTFRVCRKEIAPNDFHIEIKNDEKSYCRARMLFC